LNVLLLSGKMITRDRNQNPEKKSKKIIYNYL
jgi:hypothetical protein